MGLWDNRAFKDNKETIFPWEVYSRDDWEIDSNHTDRGEHGKLEIRVIGQPIQMLVVHWDQSHVLLCGTNHSFPREPLPCPGPLAGLVYLLLVLTGWPFPYFWLFNDGVLLDFVLSHLTMHYLPLLVHITLAH